METSLKLNIQGIIGCTNDENGIKATGYENRIKIMKNKRLTET